MEANHHVKSQRKWLKNGREVFFLKEVSTLQMVKDSDERMVKTEKKSKQDKQGFEDIPYLLD